MSYDLNIRQWNLDPIKTVQSSIESNKGLFQVGTILGIF